MHTAIRPLLLACALAACGQTDSTGPAASACAREATHEVAWSSEGAADIVTARADGPSCAQAMVTLVVRKANGDLLLVAAAPYFQMISDSPQPPAGRDVTTEEMDQFLRAWAAVSLLRSSEAAEWAGGAPAPAAGGPLQYDTPLDRLSYNALRARDEPMLCYAAATETSSCLIYDPVRGETHEVLRFGL